MIKMSNETEFNEIKKGRVYQLKVGGIEISAMKLEGYKATQLGGTVSPLSVGASGSKVETDDWLIIAKDKDNVAMPYEVWVQKAAQAISEVSGSNIGTVSVVSGLVSYKTTIVNSVDELARAIEEGWTEPYQFKAGQWILKKPR